MAKKKTEDKKFIPFTEKEASNVLTLAHIAVKASGVDNIEGLDVVEEAAKLKRKLNEHF